MLEFALNTSNFLDFGIINLHLIFLYLNTRVSRINPEVIVEVLMIYGLVISKKKKKKKMVSAISVPAHFILFLVIFQTQSFELCKNCV